MGDFLSSPDLADVRRKLGGSGCTEAHALILVPGFTTAPFGAANLLMGYGTPSSAPALPHEVSHVWLASMWSIGNGWRWDPDAGWLSFSKLQDRAG